MRILSALLLAGCLFAQPASDECQSRKIIEEKNAQAVQLLQRKEWAKAAAMLEEIRAMPAIAGMEGQRINALYNLACAHSLLGRKQQALEALAEAAKGNVDWWHAEQDRDFDNIRGSAEFTKLVMEGKARQKARRDFWDSPALSQPYRPDLSDEEKIAGLSKFWAEAKYNFAFFEQRPGLDWDALYLQYIPKIRKTGSTAEYYRVLQEFCAQLKDSHTNVWPPKELIGEMYARPRIRTRLIEGKVIVVDAQDVAKTAGVAAGMEVLAVDGMAVRDYAASKVAPYVSASTPQDMDVRAYEYYLLSGADGSEVELTLKGENGAVVKARVARTMQGDAGTPPFQFEMLGGGIALVKLNTFGSRKVVDEFDAAWPRIEKTSALILDVRDNGGGSSGNGWSILGYLTDKPFASSRWGTRLYRPSFRAWGTLREWHDGGTSMLQPHGAKLFRKPVVVLTSPHTFSAAEDFVVVFDAMKRGTIIGEPTGGSTGQPLSFPLPGGGSARVCSKHDTYPDRKEFVGVGVRPQVVVSPTVADFRAGRDTVLEAAVQYLKKKSP